MTTTHDDAVAHAAANTPQLRSFLHNMLSGGLAGLSVDVTLYPLDTIKTRMQSHQGFFAAGGFTGVYRGLSSTALGSAPGAALFFTTYEHTKTLYQPYIQSYSHTYGPSLTHCAAACTAEIAACVVRVPTENVKQKMQVGLHQSMTHTARHIIRTSGLPGFYTGYMTTLAREIPFSLIQFPLYEYGKLRWARYKGVRQCQPYEAAAIGSCAGAIAAALTTPIDVAKTRIMLGQQHVRGAGMVSVMRHVYSVGGVKGLFAGVQPRVAWISIGGFVFFGSYEMAHVMLNKVG